MNFFLSLNFLPYCLCPESILSPCLQGWKKCGIRDPDPRKFCYLAEIFEEIMIIFSRKTKLSANMLIRSFWRNIFNWYRKKQDHKTFCRKSRIPERFTFFPPLLVYQRGDLRLVNFVPPFF